MIRRRELLSAPFLLSACATRERRPNVLFVIADDMSYPHASVYGDPLARTPAFDRVAKEGVLFTHSFSCCPSCTPSRSSVLTGRPIWQLEEAGVLYGTIPPHLKLFPHLFEDAGYCTGFTGKGWAPGDWRAAGLARHPIGAEYNRQTHSTPVRPGLDQRDYAANFAEFLKRRPKDQPFFFWLGATEPHRVYDRGAGLRQGKKLDQVRVPAFLPDHEEIRSDLLDYYTEIEWFDAQLARALGVLEQTGELDNTLLLVTSDNGMPFPRAKVNLYDAGVRMPLAIRWGNRFRGGRRIEHLISHLDLAPTILEAARVAAPSEMTGRSLLPLLDGAVDARRDRVYTALERHTMCRPDGATYPMRAIRTRQFLYIRNFAPDRWPTGGPEFVSSNKTFHGDVDGCPTKDFLLDPASQKRFPREFELCFGRRPEEELYDVAADPGQIQNLASDATHRSRLTSMRADLEQFLRATKDPRIGGRDPWQEYAYRQTTGFGASFNRSLSQAVRRLAAEGSAHRPE